MIFIYLCEYVLQSDFILVFINIINIIIIRRLPRARAC